MVFYSFVKYKGPAVNDSLNGEKSWINRHFRVTGTDLLSLADCSCHTWMVFV